MSNISMASLHEVDRIARARHTGEDQLDESHRQIALAQTAHDVVEALMKASNGSTQFRRYIALELATEHRTLLAQAAKAMAEGLLLTTDPERTCSVSPTKDSHPAHDGRLDCDTILGALLIRHQSYI